MIRKGQGIYKVQPFGLIDTKVHKCRHIRIFDRFFGVDLPAEKVLSQTIFGYFRRAAVIDSFGAKAILLSFDNGFVLLGVQCFNGVFN